MIYGESEVAQSCLTLCDPMDCSLPGSSVHGIFPTKVLEWVAISFSRRSFFSTQGSNLCLQHWKTDSLLLSHLGSWESNFLGRLIRSLGVPKGRGVWNSQGGKKDKLFFPLHSLGLYNNNASCLRTVSGLNLLANPVILKCKLWE